ncbi:MAG: transporter substrate-binding domain-containing protein [Paraglaciecola sp.]|uniref:substrate-binding periplasmic protein n=1 Tax=Paraglaciecola sp. TaxID=1920173 RepID=UPI0032968FD2
MIWLFVGSTPLLANESAKVLRLAVIYVEEPPFVYTKNSSEYLGIVPSLARALSRELGMRLEFLPTARKGLEQSLIEEKADMTWLSPDWVMNKDKLIFSDSVFLHREFLYSKEPFVESSDPLDWLQDKTICIRQDYQYPSLNRFFEDGIARAVKVSSQVPLVKLLVKERCDVMYVNEFRESWMIASLGIKHKLWRSSKALAESDLGFIFNQNWQTKMPQVNQALTSIKASGELDTIIQSNIHPKVFSKIASN